MWWLLIPGFFVALLAYILFARLYVEVNSEEGFIGFGHSKLAEVKILVNRSALVLRVRVAWWKREIDLTAGGKRPPERRTETMRTRNKTGVRKLLRKFRGIVNSFRITRCVVLIDTGDMAMNAILYPWFYLLKLRSGEKIAINFTGGSTVIIRAENSLARMLWAYIKS